MSTRGTYQIGGKLLYNHSDNYPSGAAIHFLNVIEKGKALSFVNMIRCTSGPNFEPTDSIYDGPAEFHYKIKNRDGKIFVETYSIQFDKDELTLLNELELDEFINNGLKKECGNEKEYKENEVLKYSPRYSNYTNYGTRKYFTEKREELLNSGMRMLLHHGGIGNASSDLGSMADIATLLNDVRFAENYNKFISPIFQKAYNHDTPEHFEIKILQPEQAS